MKFRLVTLAFCVALLGTSLMAHGCVGYNLQPKETAAPAPTKMATEADPQAALEEIYYDVQIMGVQEATSDILDERFRIASELYTSADVRVADGRYGVADVFILKPAAGKEDELKEALEQVKLARIMEFKNYDIYNSLQLAEDGQIFTRGDYLVLIMIENPDQVREVIERHIPS